MKSKAHSARGQVLILIAFAIMGLVAMTGLAVDTGLTFSDRRHAQNAADTASIAGAMAMLEEQANGNVTHDPAGAKDGYYVHVVTAAMDLAADNGYSSDLVSNTVYVYTCDMPASSCGYYAGKPDYVQVIIESHINTFFARVIGVTQTHNTVQAVALADDDDSGPLFNGENIIALSTQCEDPDNFIVEGSANVTVTGGGLYVNTSDPACGFKCNTSSGTITGDVTTAGGSFTLSDHCSASITGEKSTGGEQWTFPVTLDDVGLDVPTECSGPTGTYHNEEINSIDPDGAGTAYGTIAPPYTVLTPGSYWDFPPKKEQPLGALYDTIYMQPGVYCVNNVVKLIDTKLVLVGHDVTLFLRDGYAFNMNGGQIRLDAPDTGATAGYLIILEPNYTGYPDTWVPENCTLTGNSLNYYEGAIFAPTCNLTVNGADTSEDPTAAVIGFESQIIAYTVKINGNKDINFSYNADENPAIIDPAKTGLVR